MIGQEQVVLVHVEDSHIIDSQGVETIGSLEREAVEARKRGFDINSVIVTMTREATRKFIDYTPENFSDICCISVEDLTQDTVDYVRNVIRGKSNARSMMVILTSSKGYFALN